MMRCYVTAITLLFGVTAARAQQGGSNVVPNDAQYGAFRRALNSPRLPPVTAGRNMFWVSPPIEATSKACAIHLETLGTPTNDKIAQSGPIPQVDPQMALAPPIPACPEIGRRNAKP